MPESFCIIKLLNNKASQVAFASSYKSMAADDVYQGDSGGILPKGRPKEPLHDVWTFLKRTAFIVGSAAVVFVALRNSLTYHLQMFWGASGDFWQLQWNRILDIFGDNYFNLTVYGSTVLGYIVYWMFGLLYTFMDVTGLPKSLRQYKVQEGVNEPVNKQLLFKLVKLVNFNMLVISPIMAVFWYYLMELRGFDQERELPTFQKVLFEIIVFSLVEEVGFYYGHRLFHHRLLYKHFHKIHHEWQAPIAITALYAHPVEHIFANVLPILAGSFLMGSHMATSWLFYSLATLSILHSHSGYHLPFLPSPEAHDYHHLKFNQCYGVFGIMDYLHGTDDKFRLTKSFSRHTTMLSLIPPKEAYPEEVDDVKFQKGKVKK